VARPMPAAAPDTKATLLANRWFWSSMGFLPSPPVPGPSRDAGGP
jgi:hypothetical protein